MRFGTGLLVPATATGPAAFRVRNQAPSSPTARRETTWASTSTTQSAAAAGSAHAHAACDIRRSWSCSLSYHSSSGRAAGRRSQVPARARLAATATDSPQRSRSYRAAAPQQRAAPCGLAAAATGVKPQSGKPLRPQSEGSLTKSGKPLPQSELSDDQHAAQL